MHACMYACMCACMEVILGSFLDVLGVTCRSKCDLVDSWSQRGWGKEKIVFFGVIKDGERLEIASKNKRTKYIEFEDLEPYIMSRTRRGKKIDNKYTHKNAKLIYNTGEK